MHDALIIAGTALIGGLVIDLQRRLPVRQQIIIGLPLLAIGWILMLAMSASGPFPTEIGMAIGSGLLLTGIVLLVPSATKTFRTRRDAGENRKA